MSQRSFKSSVKVEQPRNRIKRHQRVRAGDLVRHELNPLPQVATPQATC